MSKSCSTCAHIARQWSEHPCATCSQGEERGNWEARVELRTGDGLARKIRRRAIAREWSTYLGRKIRARDVKAMQGLADDVEGAE